MKNNLLKLIFVGIMLLYATSNFASHIVGGEVSYTFNAFNTDTTYVNFNIELIMYRDPSGIDFDQLADFGVFKENLDGTWSLVRVVDNIPIGPVLNISANADPCKQELLSNDIVETTNYNFDIDLEISDQSYLIAYLKCCRNFSLNNISDPGDTGAVYDITISPDAQKQGNTSPKFKTYPPIYICSGFDLYFDNSAEDLNGDELRYSFCAPSNSGFNPDPVNTLPPFENVNYILPFSAINPVGGNPQISIDNETGIISGFPNSLGSYVVGVCIEEYRDGKLLSRVRRDFEFNVVNCVYRVLAEIKSDEIISDPKGISNKDFYLIDSCKAEVINFTNASIHKQNILAYQWQFYDADNNLVIDTIGSDLRDPSITFPSNGYYEGQMIVFDVGGNCTDTANIIVNIYPIIDCEFSFSYDACTNGPVAFENLTDYAENDLLSWTWFFGDGDSSNEKSPAHKYKDPGINMVTLVVEDINGCVDSIMQEVEWVPFLEFEFPQEQFFDTIICPGDSVFINQNWIIDNTQELVTVISLATGCDSLYQSYNINFYEPYLTEEEERFVCLGDSTFFDNTWYQQSGVYVEYIKFKNSSCDSLVRQLLLTVGEEAAFVQQDTLICYGESIEFFDRTLNETNTYQSIIPSGQNCDSIIYEVNLIVEQDPRVEETEVNICDSDSIFFNNQWLFDEGVYYETVQTSITACDSIQKILDLSITPPPDAFIEDSIVIFQEQDFKLVLNTSNQNQVLWTPSAGLSCTNCFEPTVNLNENQTFDLTITNEVGCSTKRSIYINIEKPVDFYVANVIDPSINNDSSLFLQCNEDLSFNYDLWVYDRWGNEVFYKSDIEANDKDKGWNGGQWDSGVYIYMIQIKGNVLPNVLSGTISLLR